MELRTHNQGKKNIAELISDEVEIKTAQDGLDLLGNVYYQNFDGLMIFEEHLTAAFFDLKTGIAGEILQKFSNYRIRLAIIGDFSKFTSKSMKDFIFESNKMGQVIFVGTIEEALAVFYK